ncbi:hypothetical protein TNCV_763231 [Trichonephila clavipes]|nr:hypothetical protein TNCV_763231 [Trichonephila clavipes]
MTKCSTIEPSWAPHGVSDPGWNKLHCVDGSKPPLVWTLSRIPSAPAHSVGILRGRFRKMKKFNQTSYKLPPPTPIHVPAEKRPLEEKGSTRNECASPHSDALEPVQVPDVPQSPVQIPLVLEPVQIPLIPQSPVQIPDVLEPVQIPVVPKSPVQIPDVLELVQIPDDHNHLCRFHLSHNHLCRFKCHKS